MAEARAFATAAEEMDPHTFDAVAPALEAPVPLHTFHDEGDDHNGHPRGLDLPEGTPVACSRGEAPRTPASVRFIARLALTALDQRERVVIEHTVMAPALTSARELAPVLDVSHATVTRARAAAFAKMRVALLVALLDDDEGRDDLIRFDGHTA